MGGVVGRIGLRDGGRCGGGKNSDASGFRSVCGGGANVRAVGLRDEDVVLMVSWVLDRGDVKKSLHGVAWKRVAGAAALLDGKGVAAGGEW